MISAPPRVAVDPTPDLQRRSSHRTELLAAVALAFVYLAVMSGHLHSMDGLFMYRQAYSLVFEQSLRFETPVWIWKPEPVWTSKYGIGLSLLYVPGMLLAAPLHTSTPMSPTRPENLAEFYWTELYLDPLYTVAGAPVHVVIVAATAFLVACFIRELGFDRRAALWGLAFYGLGSSAPAYARGDFSQPLAGLCWVAALLAAVRFRRTYSRRALWACAAAVCYAVLTRPVEGSLLVPAVLLILLPRLPFSDWRQLVSRPALIVGAGYIVAVATTLLVNWGRNGSAFKHGYVDEGWVIPGVAQLAGVLVSPGRGILWEFPAIVLVPVGLWVLSNTMHKRIGLTMVGLAALQLANVAAWHMWWGGWNWGLRLFVPAIPLLAILAGIGVTGLRTSIRRWLPVVLLAAGVFWVLPGMVIDMFGGYGAMANETTGSYRWSAYPPLGAWEFLHHWRAEQPFDWHAADIMWFRIAHATGNASLIAPIIFLSAAAVLARRASRPQRLEYQE